MIRTKLVELSTIEAVAYRQKLRGGKSGIVLRRYDSAQPGLAAYNGKTGEPDLAPNVPADLFPVEAFREAIELTSGMPYSRRGAVVLSAHKEAAEEVEETAEELETVDCSEYASIVETYTNKKGELSYELLNKDFIQFAKSSKVVADLVAKNASVDEIRSHIVKVKMEAVTGNKQLTVGQATRIVDMLDEVSPKGVFRELNDEIRKMLAR